MHARIAACALLLMSLSSPLRAQSAAATPVDSAVAEGMRLDPPVTSAAAAGDWRPLRVAKWTTAAAATGLAVYGVISNRRADERFEELEQICVDEPGRCADYLPDGDYADAELERQYQDVRALDRRARTALIAGQVGVAASVVLFLLDLRNQDGPANIPYEPRSFDVMPARDGGVSLRMNVRMPAHR